MSDRKMDSYSSYLTWYSISSSCASAASSLGVFVDFVTFTIWASNHAPMFKSLASTSSLIFKYTEQKKLANSSETFQNGTISHNLTNVISSMKVPKNVISVYLLRNSSSEYLKSCQAFILTHTQNFKTWVKSHIYTMSMRNWVKK